MQTNQQLYDFTKSSTGDWEVEDDTVMGGKSSGHFTVTNEGHGRFYGHVSLANDGGFSSVQRTFPEVISLPGAAKAFRIRVKGDGETYTLRVQSAEENEYLHEASFPTSGKWETVEVPFSSMKAMHHGEPVDVPNYQGGEVYKLQLMIGNKKEQDFEILVDWIGAE